MNKPPTIKEVNDLLSKLTDHPCKKIIEDILVEDTLRNFKPSGYTSSTKDYSLEIEFLRHKIEELEAELIKQEENIWDLNWKIERIKEKE